MALCIARSRPDMYGLGIRLAVYIQWLAVALFHHIGPESMSEIRLLGLILSSSLAISLLLHLAEGGNGIDAAGIYILILLTTGSHLFLVPVYAWRALTCFRPWWNPLAWSGEEQLRIFRIVSFTLILVVSAVAVWFFSTHVPRLERGCLQFGFFFGKTALDGNTSFLAFNAVLYLLILQICVAMALGHVKSLRHLHLLSNLTVLVVLVFAVELSVRWNELSGSSDMDTSAQLIPLLVSIGIVVRCACMHYVEEGDDERSSDRPSVHYDSQTGWEPGHFETVWLPQRPARARTQTRHR
ncbi:hypothetical protein DCS_04352 [Drechmeria coniospora]|uniref:Uncharacterized protein n=1 Tax=Drechmeria coniospora TaxID=98403 RepID=A0A151GJN6_DRECN|nr:hypothetical protein DCS_04352 [Drechmeria coniospora]KYK57343.1 hypothetical protein DCS_04352 [Drechmeria coniospora]